MHRRLKLAITRTLTNIFLIGLLPFSVFAKDSPNILFFITDDQSWDSLGFMGGKVHTPRLEIN
jgi:hypothetical protein